MTDIVNVIARAIAIQRYGSDGYRDEDDGVQYWELCEDESRSVLSALEAKGMVIAPKEPTLEMVDAGHRYVSFCEEYTSHEYYEAPDIVWRAMLAARPTMEPSHD